MEVFLHLQLPGPFIYKGFFVRPVKEAGSQFIQVTAGEEVPINFAAPDYSFFNIQVYRHRSTGEPLDLHGVEKPVLYIGPGCFYGEEGIFHSQPVIYNAVAIKDMEVLAIERQSSWDVISRPSLALVLIKSVSLKSRILAHQVKDFAFRNTVEKVCRLLYCLLTDPESNFYNNRMKLTFR